MSTCNLTSATYEELNSAVCQNAFLTNCVQNLTSDAGFNSAWSANTTNPITQQFCANVIEANTLTPQGLPNSDTANIHWAQQAMVSTFNQYFNNVNNGQLSPIPNTNNFQDFLYTFCLDTPGACTLAVTNICSGVQRSEAADSIVLGNFCGCNLPSSQYALYENQFGISQQCDPLCAKIGVIPLAPGNGETLTCESNICIIDQTTLTFIDSSTGTITFSQICGGCEVSSSCTCNISGLNISATNSTIGNINLDQNCQGGIQCWQSGPNGEAVQVPCDSSATNNSNSSTSNTTIGGIPIEDAEIIFAILLIIVLIFAFIVGVIQIKKS